MDVPVSAAKAQLLDLIRRAEAGEEIVLTRHGAPVVQLVPVVAQPSPEERRALIEEIRATARRHVLPGPSAARSQDFLYDTDGRPT